MTIATYQSTWKTFADLTNGELYAVLKLRQDVFVVEQACPFADIDDHDQVATHLLLQRGDLWLAGYCRVFAPHASQPMAAIGRILTHSSVRGQRLGHRLVKDAVAYCHRHFENADILIRGQSQLTDFYRQHGFKVRGEEYLEDGLPHTDMILLAANDHKTLRNQTENGMGHRDV